MCKNSVTEVTKKKMDTAFSRRSILSRRKICEPKPLVWPTVKDEEDDVVKEIIERIFKKHRACMITVSEQNSKKDGSASQLTYKQKEEKKIFKSTFVLGFNAIIRRLEKDQLRLVLMNKSMFPPVLKKAVLSLAIEQGCLAVTISDLLSPIQTSWKAMKSVTCLGVTKTEGHDEFDELVNFIREKLPAQKPLTSIDSKPSTCKQSRASDIQETRHLEPDKNVEQRGKKQTEVHVIEPDKNVAQRGKKQTEVHVRPSVDFTKYYRERMQPQQQQKTFGGENFISLAEDTDEVIVFQNGKKVTDEVCRDIECYGIKPVLVVKSSAGLFRKLNGGKSNNTVSTVGIKSSAPEGSSEQSQRGVKRELESLTDGSGYRSITVKQLKPNENKKKKNKKMKKEKSK